MSAIVCCVAFGAVLHALCERDGTHCNVLSQPDELTSPDPFFPNGTSTIVPASTSPNATVATSKDNTWSGWATDRYQGLALAQSIAAWLFVVYTVFISFGCVRVGSGGKQRGGEGRGREREGGNRQTQTQADRDECLCLSLFVCAYACVCGSPSLPFLVVVDVVD